MRASVGENKVFQPPNQRGLSEILKMLRNTAGMRLIILAGVSLKADMLLAGLKS